MESIPEDVLSRSIPINISNFDIAIHNTCRKRATTVTRRAKKLRLGFYLAI